MDNRSGWAKKVSYLVLAALAALALSACSGMYPNDKMWISQEKFAEAKTIYDATDSLALTRERLLESPTWRVPEANEAVYRLRKFYRLEQE